MLGCLVCILVSASQLVAFYFVGGDAWIGVVIAIGVWGQWGLAYVADQLSAERWRYWQCRDSAERSSLRALAASWNKGDGHGNQGD